MINFLSIAVVIFLTFLILPSSAVPSGIINDGGFDIVYFSSSSPRILSAFRLAIADVWHKEGGEDLFPGWNVTANLNENWVDRWKTARAASALFKCLSGRQMNCACSRQWRIPGVVSLMYDDVMFSFQQECEVYGVVHVATATSGGSSTLADYPNLVRIVPPGSAVAIAQIRLVESYGWKTVTYLVGKSYGTARAEIYQSELYARGIRAAYGAICGTVDDFIASLLLIKQSGSKIILTSLADSETTYLLLAAKNLSMLNGEYAFLCTDAAFAGSLQLALLSFKLNPADYIKGLVGMRPSVGVGPAFDEWYTSWKSLNTSVYPGASADINFWVTSMYDGSAALMKGIMKTLKSGEDIFNSTTLMSNIMSLNYTGITGPISFSPQGERKGTFDVVYFDQNALISVAGIASDSGAITLNKSNPIVWMDGTTKIPVDVLPSKQIFISTALLIFFFILTGLFILLSFALLILITLKKNVVIIQHSGYMYLTLILIGVIGLLSSVYIFGTDMNLVSQSRMNDLCVLQVWFVGIFFILLFSPLFMKSVRILWITKLPTLDAATQIDRKIVLIIFITLIIEIIILGVWTGQDPLKAKAISKSLDEVYYFCESDSLAYPIVWLIYKGILLCFGIVIGYLSRNFDKRFNESKVIAFSIYNAFVISMIVVPLSFIQKEPDVHFIIKCIGVIGCALGCCGMIFVGKLAILVHGNQSTPSTVSSQQTFSKKNPNLSSEHQ